MVIINIYLNKMINLINKASECDIEKLNELIEELSAYLSSA